MTPPTVAMGLKVHEETPASEALRQVATYIKTTVADALNPKVLGAMEAGDDELRRHLDGLRHRGDAEARDLEFLADDIDRRFPLPPPPPLPEVGF